jgi:hypothetical protein
LKIAREKSQVVYKDKPIRITADFSTENLKARAWNDVFQSPERKQLSIYINIFKKAIFPN